MCTEPLPALARLVTRSVFLQVRSLSDLHQQAQKYNAQLQEYNGKLQQEISSASQGLMKLQVRQLATLMVCHVYPSAACPTAKQDPALSRSTQAHAAKS